MGIQMLFHRAGRRAAVLYAFLILGVAASSVFIAAQYVYRPSSVVSLVGEIPVGSQPSQLAINPVTNRIYVLNEGSGSISVINGLTQQVITTIDVGRIPAGQQLIDINSETNTVYVIRATRPQGPWAMELLAIDGASSMVAFSVQVCGVQFSCVVNSMRVDSSLNITYVLVDGRRLVLVDDGHRSVLRELNITQDYGLSYANSLDVDQSTHRILLTQDYTGDLWVVDGLTFKLIARNIDGGGESSVLADPSSNRIFVSTLWQDVGRVEVIDARSFKVLRELESPQALCCTIRLAAVNPNTGRLYAISGSTLLVLDGTSYDQLGSLTFPYTPSTVGLNVSTNKVYVVLPASGRVMVVQG
jgi:YVTN family beta-propeller protein